MKKTSFIISLLLFTILMTGHLHAQIYSPGKSVTLDIIDNETHSPKIHIINTGSTALDLSWKVASNTMVAGWDYALCDWNLCYTSLPAGVTNPPDIAALDTVFIYPMISANSTPGSGTLKIRIFPSGTSLPGDTLAFTFNVSPSIGINDLEKDNNIKIYPNPAKDEVKILLSNNNENNYIQLYNASMQMIFSENSMFKKDFSINTSAYDSGIYFLKVLSNEHTSYQKLWIVK